MIKKLNVNVAINSLSFGAVSINILRQFWLKGIDINLFPIGGQIDVSSYDKFEPEFFKWIEFSAKKALKDFSSNDPEFSLWHINSSDTRRGKNKSLLTFHELDGVTEYERNILNAQDSVFVTSKETKRVFEEGGVIAPVHYVPLGFDSLHYYKTQKRMDPNVTCWLISGKFEKRKATVKSIRSWLKKFGNNKEHYLHIGIYNPHLKPEDNQKIQENIFEGKKYWNVGNIPYVQTLSQLNDIYNNSDIVVNASCAEGWSLPDFNTICLGKHGVIHNVTSMSDWAPQGGAVMFEPNGKELAYDGIFFHPNGPYNQGSIYTWAESDFENALDQALVKYKENPINEKGIELGKQLTWENTANQILENLAK